MFQLQAKDSVVRIGGSATADCLNGIQSLSWDSAMNAENLEELGNPNYTGKTIQPSVSGSFEARATGSIASMLGRMIYQINGGTGEFTGYMGAANTHLIRETDLQFACFDLIEAQRNDAGVFDRSTLIPRAYLSQLSLSANADGTATESYSFDADLLEVYRTPYHDLVSVAATRKTGSLNTTIQLPAGFAVETTNVDAVATWKVHAVDVDGTRILPSQLTVTPAPSNRGTTGIDELVLTAGAQTAGVVFTKGAKIAVVMYRKTPGAFPSIVNPTTARFVKADSVNIWLINPATTFLVGGQTRTVEAHLAAGVDLNLIPFADADLFLRVQSIDFSVDLGREELKELRKNDRGNATYFRAAKYPLNITASLNATVTNLNDWAKMQGRNEYGSVTPDILNLGAFEGREWVVATRYYKGNTVLQTVALLDAAVDGLGQNVSVGGRSERSWNLTGSKLAIKGGGAV
jgi:hypothetical protein